MIYHNIHWFWTYLQSFFFNLNWVWMIKDTWYLTSELWGVHCEYLGENWPRYINTTCYSQIIFRYMLHAGGCQSLWIKVLKFDSETTEPPYTSLPANCYIPTSGASGGGASCVFPFLYGGQQYYNCTLDNSTPEMGAWCGTHYDVDTFRRWGYCLGKYAGRILGLHTANERQRYFVMTSLIGWVHA